MHHQLQELQRRSPNLDLVRAIPDLSVASGKLPSWWNVLHDMGLIMGVLRHGYVVNYSHFFVSL